MSEHPFNIPTDTPQVANFIVLTPEQIKRVTPVNLVELSFMVQENEQDTKMYLHELLKVSYTDTDQYWLPTPENPGDKSKYTPIQLMIYSELVELEKLEALDPKADEDSRKRFRANFHCTDTILGTKERENIEEFLVDHNDIFARHRFDVGVNQHFKIKLTPNDERPAYSQSLPIPNNLKGDITVELALLHK